ncbi:DUF4214 domain-containing protein [Pseudoduganella sp. OTU4001]|uniref:DUF4214 domain-containing protein n=1 Tax=Pseudoduganella sp. OTU4001 TaxID=3043854 RepID=UPI00313BA938
MRYQVVKVIAALAVGSAAAQNAPVTSIPGYRSNYTVSLQQDGSVAIQRLRDGVTQATLPAAGPLEFQDALVFFDDSGVQGQVYRLYQAAFNRTPDASGLGFWIWAMGNGVSLPDVASGFYSSAEFQSSYGQLTDTQFLPLLYRNVLKRAPDQGGLDFWLKALQSGYARVAVLRDFSESAENRSNVAATIKAGVTYYPYGGTGYTAPLQTHNPPPTPASRNAAKVPTLAELVGSYVRLPFENDYHSGQLVQTGTGLVWKNKVGQTWTLTDDLRNGQLKLDSSSPYYGWDNANIVPVIVKGKVVAIRVIGELFLRDGVPLPADAVTAGQATEDLGLFGFMYHGVADVPEGFGYGFTQYMAMYPMVDHTLQRHQVGAGFFVIPDNLTYDKPLLPPDHSMRVGAPNAGPTWWRLFQSLEGGPGNWGNTQFPVRDPKFWIVGTPDGYAHGMNSPGWGFDNPQALSRDLMSIAQLSNRIVTPPDGFTFRSGTTGDFFGYGWMALPLTDARSGTVPVGNHSWTLFFNAANFRGPVVFWVPDAFARISKTWAPAIGRGLDARTGRVDDTLVEINQTSAFFNFDDTGTLYARHSRLLFPVDGDDVTWLTADRAHYAAGALFEPVRKWFAGGSVAPGTFDRTATYFDVYAHSGSDISMKGVKVNGLDDYFSVAVMKTPGGGQGFGLKWTVASTPGVLPEYFRKDASGWTPIAAADVPPETVLSLKDFSSPKRGTTYVSPDSGSTSWMSPAPAAGPYSTSLSDGSVVTYYWYKFIDQPSLQGFGWTAAEKARLQQRVELLHRNWAGTHEFMAPPTAGTLATLDAGLLVTPPAGLEIGYVPVVTRQEAVR